MLNGMQDLRAPTMVARMSARDLQSRLAKELSLMDALDLLKSDHHRVRDLFNEIKRTEGGQRKRLLFEDIRHELTVHSYVEETVFYPSFRKFPQFSELLAESFSEHAQVKSLLDEISRIAAHGPEFD